MDGDYYKIKLVIEDIADCYNRYYSDKKSIERTQKLKLNGNVIKCMKYLETFYNLIVLEMPSNTLPSLNNFQSPPKLSWVNMSKNRLKDLNGNPFKYLTYWDLSQNQLNSLKGLGVSKNLVSLDISMNYLVSLTGIEELGNLQFLNVSGNQLVSVGVLVSCRKLYCVDLSLNKLRSVKDLLVLKGLESLALLNISNNCFSQEEVEMLVGEFSFLKQIAWKTNQVYSVISGKN